MDSILFSSSQKLSTSGVLVLSMRTEERFQLERSQLQNRVGMIVSRSCIFVISSCPWDQSMILSLALRRPLRNVIWGKAVEILQSVGHFCLLRLHPVWLRGFQGIVCRQSLR